MVGCIWVALLWVQPALSGVSFNLRLWLSPLTLGKGPVTARKDLLTAEKPLLTSGKTEPWILLLLRAHKTLGPTGIKGLCLELRYLSMLFFLLWLAAVALWGVTGSVFAGGLCGHEILAGTPMGALQGPSWFVAAAVTFSALLNKQLCPLGSLM